MIFLSDNSLRLKRPSTSEEENKSSAPTTPAKVSYIVNTFKTCQTLKKHFLSSTALSENSFLIPASFSSHLEVIQ